MRGSNASPYSRVQILVYVRLSSADNCSARSHNVAYHISIITRDKIKNSMFVSFLAKGLLLKLFGIKLYCGELIFKTRLQLVQILL